MRNVVVFPQPEGPRKVVKLPRGTSSETSSTASVWRPKRLVTPTSRTWTPSAECRVPSAEWGLAPGPWHVASATRHLLDPDSPAAGGPDERQHADRHADHR